MYVFLPCEPRAVDEGKMEENDRLWGVDLWECDAFANRESSSRRVSNLY